MRKVLHQSIFGIQKYSPYKDEQVLPHEHITLVSLATKVSPELKYTHTQKQPPSSRVELHI